MERFKYRAATKSNSTRLGRSPSRPSRQPEIEAALKRASGARRGPRTRRPSGFLATLQIEESEEDGFNMLGRAIVDAVGDDPAHTAALFELWDELVEQRKLS